MEAIIKPRADVIKKLICISLGIIYIWFGALKMVPGWSPAEELAGETIFALSFHIIPPSTGVKMLAIYELIIGFAFAFGMRNKIILSLYMVHMMGTFTPLFLLPAYSFNHFPFVLTLVGQYIIKNVLFLAVGFWLWKESNE